MNELFKFCPRCGASSFQQQARNLLSCSNCGFHFYRNPAVAVAAIIVDSESKILLIRRAKDPAKGKLALPGGFVDFDETAESALHREISEELGLALQSISYLTSHPNQYLYREVTYPVLDLFFVCRPVATETSLMRTEVESVCWIEPDQVNLREIAFDSMKEALRCYFAR
jgi:ADP-ribose pyrophosphatase YjhB (NUDIX family)